MFLVFDTVQKIATIILLISSSLIPGLLLGQTLFPDESLRNPASHHSLFESTLPIQEIEVYERREPENMVLLENGYASYAFQDADWPPQGDSIVPTRVNIIFTKYPRERSFWLTDYHWLLAKRLEALFELDPRFNDTSVVFGITLQTSCDNEFEAMQLFHGMELFYRPVALDEAMITMDDEEESSTTEASTAYPSERRRLRRFMVNERYVMDSNVFNVMDRHPEWENAVAVIDWTGSMYGHGAELLLWHLERSKTSGIQAITLFNDGDRKKSRKKVLGYTGGIYSDELRSISKTIRLFNKVKKKGNGGDSPENDIEALAQASRTFPEQEVLILVADNRSCIRDFILVDCVNRPVHIILNDTRRGINHQYINLAWKTGGSLHWDDQDIYNLDSLIGADSLVFDGQRFILAPDGWVVPADRLQSGYGFCTRYYKAPRRKGRTRKRKSEPKCYFTE